MGFNQVRLGDRDGGIGRVGDMDRDRSGLTRVKNCRTDIVAGNIHLRCSIKGIGHYCGIAGYRCSIAGIC